MSVVTVEVRFAEMTGDCHYNERAHSPCKFSILLFHLVDIFTKIKLVFNQINLVYSVWRRAKKLSEEEDIAWLVPQTSRVARARRFHRADPVLRAQWVKFVRRHRNDFKDPTSKYTSLCSAHFEESCYKHSLSVRGSLGSKV